LKHCRRKNAYLWGVSALLLTLLALVHVPVQTGVAAQPQDSPEGSAELEEAERLHAQALKLYGEGKYDEAIERSSRALSIREKRLGADDLRVAESLHNLGMLYREKGDYARAEPLYLRALSIRERKLEADDPRIATTLNHLGLLNRLKGDYALAEQQYRRALAIREKVLGADDPFVANSLTNLALLYALRTDYDQAESLYRRALGIYESTVGPEDPYVATVLINLGTVYWEKGDYARAEELVRRALRIEEIKLGPEHPNVAQSLANLATLLSEKSDLQQAENMYRRALAIRERVLGPQHPLVASLLSNLSLLFEAKGDAAQAISYQSRANEIRERNLEAILNTGAESQKLLYLAVLAGETDGTVSLHVDFAPANTLAARLALTTLLRRKGRVLDTMSDQVGALRRRLSPDVIALLDRLSEARSRLSNLVLRGPSAANVAQYRAEVDSTEGEVRDLEAEVSKHSVEFRTQSQSVTLERVQATIPPSAALVELSIYRPFNAGAKSRANRWGSPRYVAYVLGRTGPPKWTVLADPVELIDSGVLRLRAALRNPARADVREIARSVDERVMRPIRGLLGNARQVLLSPDGTLNLIPFGALVDERGRYLIERYSFTYLTSGRDLLRMQEHFPNKQGVVVIANPAFDRQTEKPENGLKSADVENLRPPEFKERFGPLGGTTYEAEEIGRLIPADMLMQASATEKAIKHVRAPKILHVATHGFFLANKGQMSFAAASADQFNGLTRFNVRGGTESPLLRSGLALAGANDLNGGDGEDGVLTALEASGLDLWGTKLVVLSACETGLGDVQNGEGVYGLRRALVLAGAESQVMSLWKVSDEVTKDFMAAYYKRLTLGEGRSEALRHVQREVLSLREHAHPYFWASFIAQGDWRNLEGEDAPPD
jgi:CHAT domain-containing protein/Tfp pilus assembly protein PilF